MQDVFKRTRETVIDEDIKAGTDRISVFIWRNQKEIAKVVVVLIENMRFGFVMINFYKNALPCQAVTSWLARVRFPARLALMTCFIPRSPHSEPVSFPVLSPVACIFPRAWYQ